MRLVLTKNDQLVRLVWNEDDQLVRLVLELEAYRTGLCGRRQHVVLVLRRWGFHVVTG